MAALHARPVPSRSAPSKPSSLPTTRHPSANIREPAHLPLHRRLLFPYDPIDKQIPPIILGDSPELIEINERSVSTPFPLVISTRAQLIPADYTTSSPWHFEHTSYHGTQASPATVHSSQISINPSFDPSSRQSLRACTITPSISPSSYCSTFRQY